jgi:hypothetical protein
VALVAVQTPAKVARRVAPPRAKGRAAKK